MGLPRSSLLRAALLAAITSPACGGETSEPLGTSSAQQGGAAGAGGSAAGAGGSAAGAGGPGGGAGGSAGAGPTGKFPCNNPTPILVSGKDTGFDTCADGSIRRRQIVACPSVLPRPDACSGAAGSVSDCKTDADCTAKANGYCASSSGFEGPGGCYCNYGCTSDKDCGAGALCQCGDPVGVCVPATCSSNDGCPQGDCATHETSPGCSFKAYACQVEADECGGDNDCQAASPDKPFCGLDATGARRVCLPYQCAIGRPLHIDDALRVASLVGRPDW